MTARALPLALRRRVHTPIHAGFGYPLASAASPFMSASSSPGPLAPLRFALVGCGTIAATHARALLALPEGARLTHCVDLDPAAAAAFAARFGLRAATWAQVLASREIDAISLCVPAGLNGQLAAEALYAGKQVVIEKPMEVSLAGCDALLAAQRASGRHLAVISQHRFDPGARELRALVERGALGRLVAVDVRVPWWREPDYYAAGAGRGTWTREGGGCLMTQAVHTLDLMLWLAGPVREVFARAVTSAHEHLEVEDLVCGTLTFADGALGTLLASTAIFPGFPARLALHGTEGSAVLEGDVLQLVHLRGQAPRVGPGPLAHAQLVASGGTRAAEAAADDAPTPTGDSAWRWGDAHRAQLAEFIAAVREGRSPEVDGRAGRAAVRLIHALYDSARAGVAMRL
jgi:UDP-N-acetyl-2-amino-2-deoxyglucuronate dehydrogenase